MPDLCIHEVVRCTICHEHTTTDRAPTWRPFTARYESRCAACDFDIREGDEVCYDEGQLCHARCANA